ncbi:MAG: hypothetical protein ACI4AK_05560 [Lepagella sp.]
MKFKLYTPIAATILFAAGTAAQSMPPSPEQPGVMASTVDTPTSSSDSFDGFSFTIPPGCKVVKDYKYVAKTPDGSFGLTISTEEKRGTKQKVAYEACRRYAAVMQMQGTVVQKSKFGKCGGAYVSGIKDGIIQTIVILPHGGEETTAIILCDPAHRDWHDATLRSLKR